MSKSPLGPSLQYSITPKINNVLWTTDDPIDKETQFKTVHSIDTPQPDLAVRASLMSSSVTPKR